MALWIRDTSSVPTEGWQFPGIINGFIVRAPNYHAIFDAVKKHFEANGQSYPGDQAVIDWQCQNLSVPCLEMETRTPLVNRFTLGLPAPAPSCCGSKK